MVNRRQHFCASVKSIPCLLPGTVVVFVLLTCSEGLQLSEAAVSSLTWTDISILWLWTSSTSTVSLFCQRVQLLVGLAVCKAVSDRDSRSIIRGTYLTRCLVWVRGTNYTEKCNFLHCTVAIFKFLPSLSILSLCVVSESSKEHYGWAVELCVCVCEGEQLDLTAGTISWSHSRLRERKIVCGDKGEIHRIEQ